MTKSRAESTRELTILGFSWLFMRRQCRALADEVGVTGLGRLTSIGSWRADVVGAARVGNQYRIDLLEVKGSRADARREDMSRGKWALLPQGQRLNCWLLVSEDVRPEDYKGLPLFWGVLKSASDGTVVKTIRKPQGPDILLDPGMAAPDLFVLSYRTLTSRLPFLGRSVGESVATLSEVEVLQKAEDYLGWDVPALDVVPGGIQESRVLDIDEARTFPLSVFLNKGEGAYFEEHSPIPILGLDKKIIGYGALRSVPGGLIMEGSIDFNSGERLLLETSQGRPAHSMSCNGLPIEWTPDQS